MAKNRASSSDEYGFCTEHVEIYAYSLCKVRHFPAMPSILTPEKSLKTPLVITTPLGVFSWMFDLMPERSFVQFLQQQGFNVYVLDFGTPSHFNAQLGMSDYVKRYMPKLIQAVRQHSGQQDLALFGYSLGGLFNLMYTLYQKDSHICVLANVGTPFDYSQHPLFRYGLVRQAVIRTRALSEKVLGEPMLNRLSHVRGRHLSLYYKMMNPLAFVKHTVQDVFDAQQLSTEALMRKKQSAAWFNCMPDYPGKAMQDLLMDFFVHNHLARGFFYMRDEQGKRNTYKLKDLTMPIINIVGRNDVIVSEHCGSAIKLLTSSDDVSIKVVDGGHGGIIAGSKAPEQSWAIISDWLQKRLN